MTHGRPAGAPPARQVTAATYRALTEKMWQERVLDIAKLRGWMTYHTHDSRRSTPGFPDLVMLRGTRQLVVELKTDTGKVTREQQAWLEAFAAAGAETHVWRPRDLSAVVHALA